jgi:hypothetical protein
MLLNPAFISKHDLILKNFVPSRALAQSAIACAGN